MPYRLSVTLGSEAFKQQCQARRCTQASKAALVLEAWAQDEAVRQAVAQWEVRLRPPAPAKPNPQPYPSTPPYPGYTGPSR